ncbi:MAG: hypothetical protein KGJ78_05330 [Alphaproteobacteria bacterium]|nr:hypothetical protein [Alphaproteobacteria bacterium]
MIKIMGTVAALAASYAIAVPASAAGSFHPPASQTEKELDRMLHAADADDNELNNIVHRPGSRQTRDYGTMLTPALIAAIRKTEMEWVRRDCGGKYRKGEECGLDFLPLTCSQDVSQTYLYHTVLDLGSRVVIEYAWPQDGKRAATYTLLQTPRGWRIDGISCADGPSFN